MRYRTKLRHQYSWRQENHGVKFHDAKFRSFLYDNIDFACGAVKRSQLLQVSAKLIQLFIALLQRQ